MSEKPKRAWHETPPLGLGQQAALLARVEQIARWQRACHIFGSWFGELEKHYQRLPNGMVVDRAPRFKITKPVADAIIAMREGNLEALEAAVQRGQG